MKSILYVLFFSVLVLTSCSKDSFLNEDSRTELISYNQENSVSLPDNSSTIDGPALSFANGNGIQMINDNQTNDELERGVGVSIPLFSLEAVSVNTGSWVTLRLSYREVLVEGPCPDEVTDENVAYILNAANQFIVDGLIEISFDGEPIEIAPFWRAERVSLIYQEAIDFEPESCSIDLPWRFYINPQPPGDYAFNFVIGGVEYSRIISWVPGNDIE